MQQRSLNSSAPDVIFRRFSESIATGELAAGEKLPPESELANSMGVALMTLRAALSMLREGGLIRTVRGRNGGNFVAEDVGIRLVEAAKSIRLTQSEIRDLTDWRRAISGEACYLAAERGTEEEFEHMAQASQEFDGCVLNLPTMRMADARFHKLIAEASKSARLIRYEAEIQVEMNKLVLSRQPLKAYEPHLVRSHVPLLTAITRRNGGLARQEMLAHAEETFNWSVGLAKQEK